MGKKIQEKEVLQKIDPRVKEILILLAAGTFLAASIIAPGLPLLAKPFLKTQRKQEFENWKKFNLWRLRAVLKRLKNQKLVEIVSTKDGDLVKVTERGRRKVLSYKLDKITLSKKWDGKWRLIIYDIPSSYKRERDFFRSLLKRMRFFSLQKSVYLTPYRCEDEIEYLRQTLGVAEHIQVLKVAKLENDQVYREYFGVQ